MRNTPGNWQPGSPWPASGPSEWWECSPWCLLLMQVVTQLEHRGNHQTCYMNQTNKPRLSICVPTRIIGALGQFFLRREMIISFNNLTLVPDFSTRCRDQVQDQHKDSTHYHEDGHELIPPTTGICLQHRQYISFMHHIVFMWISELWHNLGIKYGEIWVGTFSLAGIVHYCTES